VSLQAAPPFPVCEGYEERLPIKDSKPPWESMSAIAIRFRRKIVREVPLP